LESVQTIARQYGNQIRGEPENIITGFSWDKHPATGHRKTTLLKICNIEVNICGVFLVDE
jgi:hypothetical protein